MARTIQSPGVEVKEVDLSLRPNLPVGTTVFIPGFANQGPTDELLTVSSLSEFEQIYGLPQNSAERYMYHTVKAVFQSPANLLVSRLPYGEGAGSTVADKYSVLVYPVIPRPILVDAANPDVTTIANDTRKLAWYKKETRDTEFKTYATYEANGVKVVATVGGLPGNNISVTGDGSSTVADLFAGLDATVVSGGTTIPGSGQVISLTGAQQGDFVVAKPAIATEQTLIVEASMAQRDSALEHEPYLYGEFGNGHTITVNTSAAADSYYISNPDAADNEAKHFVIETAKKRLNGSKLAEIINANFSDHLTATGGDVDKTGEATGFDVTLVTNETGALAPLVIAGEPGEKAAFQDDTISGTSGRVTVQASNFGVSGNDIVISGDGEKKATFTGTVLADGGLTDTITLESTNAGNGNDTTLTGDGSSDINALATANGGVIVTAGGDQILDTGDVIDITGSADGSKSTGSGDFGASANIASATATTTVTVKALTPGTGANGTLISANGSSDINALAAGNDAAVSAGDGSQIPLNGGLELTGGADAVAATGSGNFNGTIGESVTITCDQPGEINGGSAITITGDGVNDLDTLVGAIGIAGKTFTISGGAGTQVPGNSETLEIADGTDSIAAEATGDFNGSANIATATPTTSVTIELDAEGDTTVLLSADGSLTITEIATNAGATVTAGDGSQIPFSGDLNVTGGTDPVKATFSGQANAANLEQTTSIDLESDLAGSGNDFTLTGDGTSTVQDLATALGGVTVNAGGDQIPASGEILDATGSADFPTIQATVDAWNVANPTNTAIVLEGGSETPDTTFSFALVGGRDPYTVSQLVANANVASTSDQHTVSITSGGDVVLEVGQSLSVQGSWASDTIAPETAQKTLAAFVGGVDRQLSSKTGRPEINQWKFGETSPGADYVATTIKDAVDSVIAGLDYSDVFGVPVSTYVDEAGDGDRFWQVTNLDKVQNEDAVPDFGSVPALKAYEIPEVADLIAAAVNSVGWALSGSDRYYLGEPSNIELDNDRFQRTIKGEIKLNGQAAGKYENQKFNSFEDLITKGGAGMMIVNDKKFVINEKFEGYYVGISDNTNLNPATDFDSVGKLKSLSKRLGGTTGGYVDVPDQAAGTKSRLTFSLSAGFIFDEFGNKQQQGLDGSMSEVLENLSEFDLNTDEFSDVLTVGVFKVRQSTLEPDATKLDYLLADSVIGSTNYFRERFLSTGGTATSYFIESEAENSNNLYLKFNEGISKDAGNWLDENGFPTRKIRILPAKDVRLWSEGGRQGGSEEVNDFKVSQAFLNAQEQREDRMYIKSWQGLQRDKKAQIKHANNVYPHGVYRKQLAAAKETGNIPAKLDRIFELADNFDLFPIDITCEAGLGTVYVGSNGGTSSSFDDEEFFNIGDHSVSSTGLSGNGLYTTKLIDNRSEIDYLVNYDVIFDAFKSFSQFQRKDNIFIADPLRYIFVQGRNSKTLTSKQREAGVNFSQHIYWPLRHMMTGGTKNSSYCTTYANWGFTNDKALNRGVWVPMSGFAAAAMGNTDSNFYPWIAPAGFTRGLVSGIQDLAFYPKQKERDQLYKIGLNPIANFPNEGFAIFGQKTMQAKPSAFDRINVRRLFLYLQKAVMNTVKYFVFEPNTLFTRTQVLNVLRPIFEEVKNTQGMYDYLIVCDERNNSPDVIDRNEMVVDIYIKPTRAAEFILVNFYATRTGQDFSELIG